MAAQYQYYGGEEPEDPSDEMLWNKFRMGDQAAFAFLFKKYNSRLRQFGVKFFFDSALVDDCIQELFLQLWKKRETLPEVSTVKYYLITSLRRSLVRQSVQLKKDRNVLVVSDEQTFIPSHETQVENEQLLKDRKASLERALKQLPERQREAVYLRFYEEKSYEEITTAMAINYQTARKFIYQAIRFIRNSVHSGR